MNPKNFAGLPLERRRELIKQWLFADEIHNAKPLSSRGFQCSNALGIWHLSESGVVTLTPHTGSSASIVRPCDLIKLKEMDTKNSTFKGLDCLDTSQVRNWIAFKAKHAKRAREQAVEFGGGSVHSAVPAEIFAALARCKTKRTNAGSWWSMR